MLIMIEVSHYESQHQSKSLNEQVYAEKSSPEKTFWANATKYASSKKEDDPFVSEMAYLMVTLHRTGA